MCLSKGFQHLYLSLSMQRSGGNDIKTITTHCTHWQSGPIPKAELIPSFKQAQKKKKLTQDGVLSKNIKKNKRKNLEVKCVNHLVLL